MIQQANEINKTDFNQNPFNLDHKYAYQTWRAHKLENYPSDLSGLVVEINDPRQLNRAEQEAILARCRVANMAVYVSTVTDEDKAISHGISKPFNLTQLDLDSNICADDDGITSLTVANGGTRQTYIPYTNRPINWHTDGYYNSLDKQIHAFLLHCVRSAEKGGENALLDYEIAYILLRDENPEYIHALMQPDVMCIPPNVVEGTEIRPIHCGPVFSIMPDGNLHMRYTKRTRSITWKQDKTTTAAVKFLENVLDSDSAYIFRSTLQSGQGLISNNVLHNRTGFNNSTDASAHRLLYRTRYYQRVGSS